MIYSGWIEAVCALLEYTATDSASATPTDVAAFNTSIPAAIDYTENRLQRDLNLLVSQITSTGYMTANSRLVTLPSVDLPAVGTIPILTGMPIPAGSVLTAMNGSASINIRWPGYNVIVADQVSILTPIKIGGLTLGGDYAVQSIVDGNNFTIDAGFPATSGQSVTLIGNGIYVVCSQIRPIVASDRLQPLEPVTRDYLDFAWPSDNSVGAGVLPVQWCPNDQTSVLVGPAPDQAYAFEAVGTMRIPQLSATNYTNFLTQQFPDLYVAASMVYFSGYQRDFGSQSDDPKLAVSWEQQYQTLLKSSVVEEARKQFADMFPSPSTPVGLTAQG